MTKSEFLAVYGGHAQRASAATGVPAEFILGQWALETGWGNHFAGQYNLGNIQGGNPTPYNYGSIALGVDAYIDTLLSSRYAAARVATTPDYFGTALKFGGWATDALYASKIASTIRDVLHLTGSLPTTIQDFMGEPPVGTIDKPVPDLIGMGVFDRISTAVEKIADNIYSYIIFGAIIVTLLMMVSNYQSD
ncbi:MAG: glucosaminidase domain-containing protein [Candidatus Methylomirabilales bacterium]